VKFEAGEHCFTLDGKSVYLYSGEIQYFRIRRDLWKAHLTKLKAAGANAVSTYIPWSWHEVEEGVFDFTGTTAPERDLVGFLTEAAEAGLYISVKPGPYILAEFDDEGIPGWLRESHPEIMAQGVSVVTYMHPVFKRFVQKWYDQVLPLLAERQVTRGGAVALFQVCNEVGLFNWLASAGDTGKVSLGFYRAFLKKRYKKIEAVNAAYGTRFRVFEAVKPPEKPAASSADYLRWNDWHDYHRWYYSEYLSWLIGEIRGRGINIQLFHNIPGWYIGRATEYPINMTFYADIIKRHPEMIFGLDHIPENPNYRNQHDDLVLDEMLRAIQGGCKPVWAAEQQLGSREHQVRTFPNELELFYKACLGRGMSGMNLYMFSQGLNPPARGAFGPTFYWYTALEHDGQETPFYPVIAKIGGLLKTFGEPLLRTYKSGGTAVGFYRPYYHDEFYYPLFGGVPKLDAVKAGLRYDPKALRNTYYFDGLLRMLVMQNRDFSMIDLQISRPDPKIVKQLWVVAGDLMDRDTQAGLADYVEAGGHLFLWPGFPEKDLKLKSCTLLRQRLGIKEGKTLNVPGIAKIEVMGMPDINVLGHIRTLSAPGSDEIAHTRDGQCVGLTRRVGKGKATVLGTIFGYNIAEHLTAFSKLCELEPVAPAVKLSNPEILGHVRYGADYAFLFLLNYTPVPQTVAAEVRAISGQDPLRVPAEVSLTLEPLSGLMIPLNFPLGGKARLSWASCEVMQMEYASGEIRVQVNGSPREMTQIVFRLPGRVAQVTLEGRPIVWEQRDDQVWIQIPAGTAAASLSVQAGH